MLHRETAAVNQVRWELGGLPSGHQHPLLVSGCSDESVYVFILYYFWFNFFLNIKHCDFIQKINKPILRNKLG